MRLTEQSRYALRVLAFCAERHPALAKTGFLQTTRGPHGGVRLAVAPSTIRVGQVIRAVEPRFQACGPLDVMLSEDPVSPVERALDRAIGQGLAAFMEALDQTTIASLVATGSATIAA